MQISNEKAHEALSEALDTLSRAHEIISRLIGGKPVDMEILESYFWNATCLRDCFPDEPQETLGEFLNDAYGGLEPNIPSATASTDPPPTDEPKQ